MNHSFLMQIQTSCSHSSTQMQSTQSQPQALLDSRAQYLLEITLNLQILTFILPSLQAQNLIFIALVALCLLSSALVAQP